MWIIIALMSAMGLAKDLNLEPTWEEFRKACRATHQASADAVVQPWEIGTTVYIPVGVLERAQATIGFDRVLKALKELNADGMFKGKKLPFDSGHALYPPERRITGIFYRGRIYIIDGHHRAFISCYAGARTLPVELRADWSDKSEEQFFADMRAAGYSYFYDLNNHWAGPGPFTEVQNDPLIYLARRLLRRVDFSYDSKTGKIEILRSRGADLPIGFKLNRDIPFLEQEIARELRRAGVKWRRGDRLGNSELKDFLKILKSRRDGSLLSQVLLLQRPTPVVELNEKKLIEEHIRHVQCESQLLSGDQD